MDNEEWKLANPDAPTPQDMVKYASQRAKLLVQLPQWFNPSEIYVSKVINGGEYFLSGSSLCGQWYRTSDIRVLAIIPPASLEQWSVDGGVKRRTKAKKDKKAPPVHD